MLSENSWLEKETDSDGGGGAAISLGIVERITHTWAILEHISLAGHLKDPSKEGIVRSLPQIWKIIWSKPGNS